MTVRRQPDASAPRVGRRDRSGSPVARPRLCVTVDVGKSGTRGRVTGAGAIADAAAAGVPPHTAGTPRAGDALAAAVVAVWNALATGSPGITAEQVTTLVIGSTAIPPHHETASFLSAVRLVWPHATVVLAEDGVLAHAAALGRPGVVASIGTGTIVVGVNSRARWVRLDGWGPDLGDRGSAVWLGTQGLRAAFAALDGAGPATVLLDGAQRYVGGADVDAAIRLLARPDRVNLLAAFAQEVCDAAAGDAVAADLVQIAAAQAGETIAAAARRTGTSTVAVVGGLGSAAPYQERLAEIIAAAGLDLVQPGADVLAVDPAVMLAPPYPTACQLIAPPDATSATPAPGTARGEAHRGSGGQLPHDGVG